MGSESGSEAEDRGSNPAARIFKTLDFYRVFGAFQPPSPIPEPMAQHTPALGPELPCRAPFDGPMFPESGSLMTSLEGSVVH